MRRGIVLAVVILLLGGSPVHSAFEWHGLLDLRAVDANTSRSWVHGGLGKQRFDSDSLTLHLGQAILVGRNDFGRGMTGTIAITGDEDRPGFLDVTEAYLSWKPVPKSAWRNRVKAGFFFPPLSLEHDGPGWTTTRTLSPSAINSWIGEEFRTFGVEYQGSRIGIMTGSDHDFSLFFALYGRNDPAGTLLTWRGWGIGDRITGGREILPLANLPVYGPKGRLAKQEDRLQNFMEVDNRLGYYVGAQYRYAEKWTFCLMNYDNKADPMEFNHGQYGWRTWFNHLGISFRPSEKWELLAQGMNGDTYMGRPGAGVRYQAWYVLVSRELRKGKLTLRRDRFRARQNDLIRADNNDEDGGAWTAAYVLPIKKDLKVVGEWLSIDGRRPQRKILGLDQDRREDSLTLAVRWFF